MKRYIKAFILLLVLAALPVSVLAHPGRTDGFGGHTDRSTGEYHYHHGYSAHQHYDIDGDGEPDCPYDFKDKTDHSTGSGNSKTNYTTTPTTEATEPSIRSTMPTTPKTTAQKEEKPVPTWVYWGFGIFFVVILFMWKIIRSQKEDIKTTNDSHEKEIHHLKENYNRIRQDKRAAEEELGRLKVKYEKNLREKNATDAELAKAREHLERTKATESETRAKIYTAQRDLRNLQESVLIEEESIKKAKAARLFFENAPMGISLSEDGKPVYWKSNPQKRYGDYTVYVKKDSAVYHTDRLCASYLSNQAHIFDYISKRRPCQKCARNAFDFTEAPEWYTATINERLSDRSDL